jgi:hypothetical protein
VNRHVTGAILGLFFTLISAASVSAQVQKVTARTTGISCGSCAAVGEIQLRRKVVGLDKLTISMSQEAITVHYKPDGLFQPQVFRDIFKPLNVGILKLEISARGRVQVEGTKRTFVSGKDQFVVMDDELGAKMPVGVPILIEGIVDDKVSPMHVKVTTFKPAAP